MRAYSASQACTSREGRPQAWGTPICVPSQVLRCCFCWRDMRPAPAHRVGTPSDHPATHVRSCPPSSASHTLQAGDPTESHAWCRPCAINTTNNLHFDRSGGHSKRNSHVSSPCHRGSCSGGRRAPYAQIHTLIRIFDKKPCGVEAQPAGHAFYTLPVAAVHEQPPPGPKPPPAARPHPC